MTSSLVSEACSLLLFKLAQKSRNCTGEKKLLLAEALSSFVGRLGDGVNEIDRFSRYQTYRPIEKVIFPVLGY